MAFKSQISVTLSSTESEFHALSEVTEEITFVLQILEFLEIEVTKPIIVKIDNLGAIYLANNNTSSQRTRYIDMRRHYFREYIASDAIKILFVPSELNTSDIFTKHLPIRVFKKHSDSFMWKDEINGKSNEWKTSKEGCCEMNFSNYGHLCMLADFDRRK